MRRSRGRGRGGGSVSGTTCRSGTCGTSRTGAIVTTAGATARRAAEKIGISHYVLNLEQQVTDAVVKPFVTSYLAGRTPIPCTTCNTEVKFKTLLERSAALGCEAVATG